MATTTPNNHNFRRPITVVAAAGVKTLACGDETTRQTTVANALAEREEAKKARTQNYEEEETTELVYEQTPGGLPRSARLSSPPPPHTQTHTIHSSPFMRCGNGGVFAAKRSSFFSYLGHSSVMQHHSYSMPRRERQSRRRRRFACSSHSAIIDYANKYYLALSGHFARARRPPNKKAVTQAAIHCRRRGVNNGEERGRRKRRAIKSKREKCAHIRSTASFFCSPGAKLSQRVFGLE